MYSVETYKEPDFSDNPEATFSDAGNALRFSLNCSAELRLSEELGWVYYDARGGIWRKDTRGIRMHQLVDALLRAVVRYGAAVEGDADVREKWRKFIRYCTSARATTALLQLLAGKKQLEIPAGNFDAHPLLLNCGNAVIDIGSGCDALEPSPDYLFTKQTGVEYDPKAKAPRWERFISEIFDGDKELMEWIQRWAGYCLTGDTSKQQFYVFYGPGGGGKTTLLTVLSKVLGSYAGALDIGVLMQHKYQASSSLKPELACQVGKRLVCASEPQNNGGGIKFNTGLVKKLVGGGTVQVRELYSSPFDWTPTMKLTIDTNERPNVPDTSDGFWRRMVLVPFNVRFEGERRVEGLDDWFIANELAGVLNWALEGAMLWHLQGLGEPPTAVLEATQQYRNDEDEYRDFFERVLVPAKGMHVRVKRAWDMFTLWRKSSDYQSDEVKGMKAFTGIAEAHGLRKTRGTTDPNKGINVLVDCRLDPVAVAALEADARADGSAAGYRRYSV